MRIKTYYAKTMAGALQKLKSGLGPDALLLSAKEIRGRHGLGCGSSGFEVVGAVDNQDDLNLLPASENTIHSTGTPTDAGPTETAAVSEVHDLEPDLCSNLYRTLIESGVHDWLAARLVNDAAANLSPELRESRPAVLHSLTLAAQTLISVPQSEDGLPGKRVVAFVGPTGVGKTTSIAKLAAHLALCNKKKVVLMTLDGDRIGAIEQLKTYAGLMGVPFRFVNQVSGLAKAIEDQGQRDYILIDTAGRGPKDLEVMRNLGSFLQGFEDIERHLVLSATTKPADLEATVDRFEICKPDHLIFTKLDETTTLGPILNELVRTHKPLSYYTDGQRVPGDLHAGSRDRIINMVLQIN